MKRSALVFIFILILIPQTSTAGGYTLSAHGNATYGVERAVLVGEYSKGNCAHCHEMHAKYRDVITAHTPYPYALFSSAYDSTATVSDTFCTKCHDGSSNVSSRIITNRSYSFRAGGYTADTTSSIYALFDTTVMASVHPLADVYNFVVNTKGWLPANTSPCVACHNPHYVQGDPPNSPNSPKINGARGWLLTLPSKHMTSRYNAADRLWGDDTSERMLSYATNYSKTYQAPLRFNSTSTYEPDGNSVGDGSTMVDMVSFCLDCHSSTATIDWSLTTGDKHGLYPADGGLDVKAPYDTANTGNYVLACTDCHEPHGAKNAILIRSEVNGNIDGLSTGSVTDSNSVTYLCKSCHLDDEAANAGTLNPNQWQYVHHYAPDAPYTGSCFSQCGWCHNYIGYGNNCGNCHFHGNSDDSVLLNTSKDYCATGRKGF